MSRVHEQLQKLAAGAGEEELAGATAPDGKLRRLLDGIETLEKNAAYHRRRNEELEAEVERLQRNSREQNRTAEERERALRLELEQRDQELADLRQRLQQEEEERFRRSPSPEEPESARSLIGQAAGRRRRE